MPDSAQAAHRHAGRWGWSACYLALFVVGVPWYWPEDAAHDWFGMPVWALVSIGASLLVSILVAWQLSQPWEGESDADAGKGGA